MSIKFIKIINLKLHGLKVDLCLRFQSLKLDKELEQLGLKTNNYHLFPVDFTHPKPYSTHSQFRHPPQIELNYRNCMKAPFLYSK